VLHLLDFDSTGSYTLVYAAAALAADTAATVSVVSTLPAASPASFSVMWSGNDGAAGSWVAHFVFFVSVNGAPFTNWLAKATSGGAIFTGTNGVSYAFYSRATDAAGNLEPAPLEADAQTITTIVNSAPELSLGPPVTVNEGETVMITAAGLDADGDAITYSLGAGSPPGMVLNVQSGQINWTTGEAHGPSTNQITVIARDNGAPPLSATQTVSVTVLEVNQPPTLAALTNRTIAEGRLLTFTNIASDADLPKQLLTFSLAAGAPVGTTQNSPLPASRPVMDGDYLGAIICSNHRRKFSS
jgi:hypothetical protein